MGAGLGQRYEQLQSWLRDTLGMAPFSIEPASADASFRRYFRVQHGQQSRIVMDAPPQHEDCQPFMRVSALMSKIGLHVPQVLQHDLQQGFLLLTDLGNRMFLPELNPATADRLYGDALQALLKLQLHGAADLPPYDRRLLMTEMALFPDWYLGRHLGITLQAEQKEALQQAFSFLADAALQQPQVIVHRDYHSRNLMVSEPNPGILDFQDAVIGPLSYDLVSLLRDCYIVWPRAQVEQWVAQYHQQLCDAGVIKGVEPGQLLQWFDLMGVQRHLKVAGIFARLYYRDGKSGYLQDIPRVLDYIQQVAVDYPQLDIVCTLLEQRTTN